LLPGYHGRGGGRVALDRRVGAQRRLEHHRVGHHEHRGGEQGNHGADERAEAAAGAEDGDT
jgi:hypothetical protein